MSKVEGGGEIAYADRFDRRCQDVNDLDAGRVGQCPVETRQVMGFVGRKRNSYRLATAPGALRSPDLAEVHRGGHVLSPIR